MSSITSYGNIPLGWENPPVYARYSVQLGKMLNEKRITGAHLAPYLRNVDVRWNSINTLDLPEMDFSEEDREHYALRIGDLLVCEGGEVGRTAVWNGELRECFFQKAIHRLRPITQKDEPRFFRYFMRMAVDRGDFTASPASTIQHLTVEKLRVVRYPAPPRETQRAIADYLDRETSRLDSLVAAKERVLALLAEKRRALVTRVVTRSLNPDAQLRNSGIPWLGEVPVHWKIIRLRFLVTCIEQGWSPQASMLQPGLDEWGVLKLNAVNRGRFDETATKSLPPDEQPRADLEVHPGDVLVTRSNTPLLVGDACFVETTRPKLMLSDIIYRLVVRTGIIDGRFLVSFLVLPVGRIQIENDAHGTSASMVKISQEHIKDWWIPVPPIDEQRSIIAALACQTRVIDQMRATIERTVTLIKERRAALITAAVTGQIDIGAIS